MARWDVARWDISRWDLPDVGLEMGLTIFKRFKEVDTPKKIGLDEKPMYLDQEGWRLDVLTNDFAKIKKQLEKV